MVAQANRGHGRRGTPRVLALAEGILESERVTGIPLTPTPLVDIMLAIAQVKGSQ